MLLTSDRGLGEDACQETLHRLAARWSKVASPDAYARRSEIEPTTTLMTTPLLAACIMAAAI